MSWLDRLRPRPRGARAQRAGGAPMMLELSESPVPARFGPKPRLAYDADLPRFQSTAGDQLDPRLNDRFSSLRIRLRSAFTPSQPVNDRRMFAGRLEALRTLIRAVEEQRVHAVIHGERGIGKTSMLNVLTQAARDARYLVINISCGERSNFDETFRAIAAHIPLLFHGGYGPTHPDTERGSTMLDLLTPTPVSTRLAGDLLASVTGTRVMIILDEFDRCESKDFRHAIGELMKDLSDRAARAQLVIAGVAANLTELLEHIPSIQRNVLALQLPKMSETEVLQMVRKGEQASGLVFDAAASQLVVSLSVGFPYLASLISHHAGLKALDEERTDVTEADVSAAADEALEELRGRISRRSQLQIRDAVTHGGLEALGTLAAAAQATGGRFNLADIAAVSGDAEERTLNLRLVDTLADEGMLIQAAEDEYGRRYRFIEASVPAYLWLLSGRGKLSDAHAPLFAEAKA